MGLTRISGRRSPPNGSFTRLTERSRDPRGSRTPRIGLARTRPHARVPTVAGRYPRVMTRFPLRRLRLRPGEEHREPLELTLESLRFGGEAVRADATRHAGRARRPARHERRRLPAPLRHPARRAVRPLPGTCGPDDRDRRAGVPGASSRTAEEELRSEYVVEGELDVGAWARDQLALEVPDQVLCRPDCAGLCPGLREGPERRAARPRRSVRRPTVGGARGAQGTRRLILPGSAGSATMGRRSWPSRRERPRSPAATSAAPSTGSTAPRVCDVRALRLAEAVAPRLPDVQDVPRARGQASPGTRSVATRRADPRRDRRPRRRSRPRGGRRRRRPRLPRTRSSPSSSALPGSTPRGSSSSRASEAIAMDEKPAEAVRAKPDSSLVRSARAVGEGDAAARRLGREHGRGARRLAPARAPAAGRPAARASRS